MQPAATGSNQEVYRKGDPVACASGERLLLVANVDGVADLTRVAALEGVARSLWEGTGELVTASGLSEQLVREFGLSNARADTDAQAFVADLVAHGLVHREGEEGPSETNEHAGPKPERFRTMESIAVRKCRIIITMSCPGSREANGE